MKREDVELLAAVPLVAVGRAVGGRRKVAVVDGAARDAGLDGESKRLGIAMDARSSSLAS